MSAADKRVALMRQLTHVAVAGTDSLAGASSALVVAGLLLGVVAGEGREGLRTLVLHALDQVAPAS